MKKKLLKQGFDELSIQALSSHILHSTSLVLRRVNICQASDQAA